MATRKSRYDSLNGISISVNVGSLDMASILSQALGDKFHLLSFQDGVVTFTFHNR